MLNCTLWDYPSKVIITRDDSSRQQILFYKKDKRCRELEEIVECVCMYEGDVSYFAQGANFKQSLILSPEGVTSKMWKSEQIAAFFGKEAAPKRRSGGSRKKSNSSIQIPDYSSSPTYRVSEIEPTKCNGAKAICSNCGTNFIGSEFVKQVKCEVCR